MLVVKHPSVSRSKKRTRMMSLLLPSSSLDGTACPPWCSSSPAAPPARHFDPGFPAGAQPGQSGDVKQEPTWPCSLASLATILSSSCWNSASRAARAGLTPRAREPPARRSSSGSRSSSSRSSSGSRSSSRSGRRSSSN